MRQVSFDTHAAARKLEQAGHSSRQAEAVVEVVSEATRFHMRMAQDLERVKLQVDNHMVTKADIANMVTKADIANMVVKDDIANMVVKDDIANMATKADIANMVVKDDIANMVVKDDIANMATKDNLRGFVMREEFAQEFARLYWRLLIGSLGLTSLIIAAIALF